MDSKYQTIKLSALDQIMPRAYTPFPLHFTVSPPNIPSALSLLSSAFSRLVSDFAHLNGSVSSAPRKGELEIKLSPTPRPELLIRDYSSEIDAFDLRCLPIGGPTSDDIPSPTFMAQANTVKGGIVLCICFHHSVMDGTGMAVVIRRWAEWCHAIASELDLAPLQNVCLDRGPIINGGRKMPTFKHGTYSFGDAASDERTLGQSERMTARTRMVGGCFVMDQGAIARLQGAIVTYLSGHDCSSAWVSTNDVLCTVLWHAIVRARLGDCPVVEGKRSKLAVPVNVRSKIRPPLPQDFIGNAVVDVTADRPLSELAIWSMPQMARTALSIRQAISTICDADIRGLIDIVDGLDDVRKFKNDCNNSLGDDLTITSWVDMGICSLDWGGSLGFAQERTARFDGYDGFCIVLPRRRDGSVKIMVGLEAGCMERLETDETLGRYMRRA